MRINSGLFEPIGLMTIGKPTWRALRKLTNNDTAAHVIVHVIHAATALSGMRIQAMPGVLDEYGRGELVEGEEYNIEKDGANR